MRWLFLLTLIGCDPALNCRRPLDQADICTSEEGCSTLDELRTELTALPCEDASIATCRTSADKIYHVLRRDNTRYFFDGGTLASVVVRGEVETCAARGDQWFGEPIFACGTVALPTPLDDCATHDTDP